MCTFDLADRFSTQQDGDGQSFQGGDPVRNQSGVREQTTILVFLVVVADWSDGTPQASIMTDKGAVRCKDRCRTPVVAARAPVEVRAFFRSNIVTE
jgi:hypothetical protein